MPREIIAGLPANEYHRLYRLQRSQDPEWRKRRLEHNRKYRERHPDRAYLQQRRRHLRTKYGITLEQYDELVVDHEGVCAACGGGPDARGLLYVDHDHACCPGVKTCGNCIRGLLCNGCNAALGHVKDDPERLLQLIEYLNRH